MKVLTINYYYRLKNASLTINYYIEGTTTKVADESAEVKTFDKSAEVKVAKENIEVKTSSESTPVVAAKPKYESPKVEIFETVPDKDLCVSEGAPSSNSIGFIDRIKSFFGIEKTAPVSESSTQTIAPRVFAPEKSGKTIIKITNKLYILTPLPSNSQH